MPKPLNEEYGSGMHTHQSLFKGDKNAFFEADDPSHLSKYARAYLGGVLKYSKEITSILAPWINSYKRLVPGFEAPVYVAWSRNNRSALIRVPQYQIGREYATRIEVRCPDPSGNPYLQLAVMLMAGLRGIEEKCDLPEPMELNLYELNEEQRKEKNIETLPSTLEEALRYSEKSDLVKETLGPHSFHRFITLKKMECQEFNQYVTDFEIKKYYPML
jgi:glutamine synthetase